MTTRPQSHPIVRHSLAQRHTRPSTIALAVAYADAMDALLALVADMEAHPLYDPEWCAYVIRLREARWEVTVLGGKLLAACGYNQRVWRKLRGR